MDTTFESAVWSTAYVNNLPDSSFACIEPGGDKDEEGKTKPRSLRHLPYKDASGKVDLAHLRNALARLPQTNISQELKDKARRKLENAAREAGVGDYGKAAAARILETLNELRAAGSVSSDHMQTLRDCHAMLEEFISCHDKMQSARIVFTGELIKFEGGERLGSMLQRKRRSKGILLDEMAAQAGISEMSYQEIEAGYNSRPPEDVLKKICAALDLDFEACSRAAAMDRDMPVSGPGYPVGRY